MPTVDAAKPFPDVTLETARTRLRPLDEADVDALFALYSDPVALRFWSTPPWTDPDEARRKIERDRRAQADGRAIGWGIVERDGGALVGTCSLHAFHSTSRRCDLGYLVARSRWGRGYAGEAAAALVAHAFGTLGLHRIEADIDPDNAASIRVVERLGFRLEGRLRERWFVGERWCDSLLYGLVAPPSESD